MVKGKRVWGSYLTLSRLLGIGLLLLWLGSHLVLLRFVYSRWVGSLGHPRWKEENVVIDRFRRTVRKSRTYKSYRAYARKRVWVYPKRWINAEKPKIVGFRQYNASPFEWVAFLPFSTERASDALERHRQIKLQIGKWAIVTKYTEPQLYRLKEREVWVSQWEGRVHRSLSPPVKVQGIVVTPIEKDTAVHLVSASRVPYAGAVEQVALHMAYQTKTVIEEVSPYSFRGKKKRGI